MELGELSEALKKTDRSLMRCYNCGKWGHTAMNCPNSASFCDEGMGCATTRKGKWKARRPKIFCWIWGVQEQWCSEDQCQRERPWKKKQWQSGEHMGSHVPRPSLAPVFDRQLCKNGRRPDESYHVIRGTHDLTGSRHEDIFTFTSPATEKLGKQDKFQPKDKSYL